MTGGAEEYAVDLFMSAGTAVFDAVKYGSAFSVTLYVDERSPFYPNGGTSNAVQWNLRPKLPLRHPVQVASLLQAVGQDAALAEQIDMDLFMFAQRVPPPSVVNTPRSNQSHASISIDALRLVSELGIRQGDELELILDANAVQQKKQIIQASRQEALQRERGAAGARGDAAMSGSRTSWFSRGENTPPSSPTLHHAAGSIDGRLDESMTSRIRAVNAHPGSPLRASSVSPHTPSFAFQDDASYDTATDAAGWPLMGAGGGATMAQILARAREETHGTADTHAHHRGAYGNGIPRSGGVLDPRLQQLLDNAHARIAAYQQDAHSPTDDDGDSAAYLRQPASNGGSRLRAIMQQSTTLQRPQSGGALDPRLQQLLDNANVVYNHDEDGSDSYAPSLHEQSPSSGGGLRGIMNAARESSASRSDAARTYTGGTERIKHADPNQMDPRLQQLIDDAEEMYHRSQRSDEDDESTAEQYHWGGGATLNANSTQVLLQRAREENYQSRGHHQRIEVDPDDDATAPEPFQSYDFAVNSQGEWEEDPWLANDENAYRSVRTAAPPQSISPRQASSALTADEILALVADAQQKAVDELSDGEDDDGRSVDDLAHQARGIADHHFSTGYPTFPGMPPMRNHFAVHDDQRPYEEESEEEEWSGEGMEEVDDAALPSSVKLMRQARRNRQRILRDFRRAKGKNGGERGDDDVDEDGNPIVLLPNIDDYLLELENEDMEMELHEISEKLQEASSAGGETDAAHQQQETADLDTLFDNEQAQQQLHLLVAVACRRSRLRRQQKKALRRERRAVAEAVAARRSVSLESPHSPASIAAGGVYQRRMNPPYSVVLIGDATHRICRTALGDRLQRAYLPSVMDLM